MLRDEIRVWSRLIHPNILPFVGYALESEDCPLLISGWMENGTVNKYVKSHPDCDTQQIVCLLYIAIIKLMTPFFAGHRNC